MASRIEQLLNESSQRTRHRTLSNSKDEEVTPTRPKMPADDSFSDRDLQARHAGQVIYQSLSSASTSSTSRLLESGSLTNSSAWTIPENQRACCGIMSPVRRTFCLITLFDLILTFILWIIYTQVVGDSVFNSIFAQVVHYTFKESMFDTVMCAAWRFIPLLLAYALFRINSPWVVALTTLGTCVFLLCKVFIFDFSKDKENIMCYLLLIVSFIITWIETWFLDFKVLPREQKARERGQTAFQRSSWWQIAILVVVLSLFFLPQAYMYGLPNERTSLLGGSTAGGNPHHVQNENYYSPVDSPQDSDDEEGGFRSGSRAHSRNQSRSSDSLAMSLGAQEQELIQKSRAVWDKAWEMFRTTDGWHLESGEKHSTAKQTCVHSRTFSGVGRGKVFRLQGIVDVPPRALFTELVQRVTELPKWSSTVLECKILTQLDDSTVILYNVAAEAAGGIVSSRDFVNLIHWAERDGVIMSAASAVTHPDMPVNNKHVRGENGPGGLIFKPIPGKPNKCHFISIVNTDLKGWLLSSIVDQALSGVLLKYMEDIKKRMARLQAKSNRR